MAKQKDSKKVQRAKARGKSLAVTKAGRKSNPCPPVKAKRIEEKISYANREDLNIYIPVKKKPEKWLSEEDKRILEHMFLGVKR